MTDAPAEPRTVTEAGLRLPVDAVAEGRGPGTRGEGVFYNPAMARNRDVSLLATVAWAEPGVRFLDGLAATGVRGLRTAAALPDVDVTLNDWSTDAAHRIREAAAANDLTDDVTVESRNLGALLWEVGFDWIDVDPFGSPAPFLDAAARSVHDGGVVAVTATDTTALHGRHPDPCLRRYGAQPAQTPFGHELALRILAAALARSGARYDRALTPVLAFADDHAYRVLARCEEAARPANEALHRLRWAFHCPACGARGFRDRPPEACSCGADLTGAGPLWSDPLQDPALLEGMREAADEAPLEAAGNALALVDALAAEAGAPPLFHDLHEAASRAGVGAAPREAVLAALRDRGYQATTTHHDPQGIRTDAPNEVLQDIVAHAADGSG